MLFALALACLQAPSTLAAPLDPLIILGWIGDADHDGATDFAVLGNNPPDPKARKAPSASLMVYSGTTLAEIVRVPFDFDMRDSEELYDVHAIDDRDGDGLGDVLMCLGGVRVLSSRDGRRLAKLSRQGAFVAQVEDCDGDGCGELVLNVCDEYGCRAAVWLSNDGSLDTRRFNSVRTWLTSVGDIDGDGSADLVAQQIDRKKHLPVLSGATGRSIVALDEQSLDWLNREELQGCDVALDVDGDGVRDVVLLAGYWTLGGIAAFSGKTGKRLATWERGPARGPGCMSRALSPGDLDGDGRAEIVVAVARSSEHGPTLLVLSGATLQVERELQLDQGAVPRRCALVVPDRTGDGRVEMLFASFGDERGECFTRAGSRLFVVSMNGDVLANITR